MPLRLADYPAVAILCIGTSSTSLGMGCLSALILLCICYIFSVKQKKCLCSVQEVGFHPYRKGSVQLVSEEIFVCTGIN